MLEIVTVPELSIANPANATDTTRIAPALAPSIFMSNSFSFSSKALNNSQEISTPGINKSSKVNSPKMALLSRMNTTTIVTIRTAKDPNWNCNFCEFKPLPLESSGKISITASETSSSDSFSVDFTDSFALSKSPLIQITSSVTVSHVTYFVINTTPTGVIY